MAKSLRSNNKVALVTGGGRRLGRDISIAFAESGYDVVVNYNESKKADIEETMSKINENGVTSTAIKCDVSNVNEVKKMFQAVYQKYKRLDVLVNNAAVFKHTDFLETNERTYEIFLNTNLKSVFFCSQEAAKIMLKSSENQCSIINIASLGAIENWTGFIPYSISKAAVIKLTQQTAKRLAPKVLVNAIAPGTIMIDDDDNANVNFEEVKKYPMKRFAKSGDLISIIKYLANENKYITGQTFVVDGGRSL